MVEPRFPEVLDNTMLKAFRVCPQRFFNEYCLGLRVKGSGVPVDLHFGTCFDKAVTQARKAYFYDERTVKDAVDTAMYVAVKEWNSEECIEYPAYSNKNLGSLMSMVGHYFATWPLGEDGLVPLKGRGVQMHIEEKLPFKHPATGKALVYAMNPDFVARNDAGGIVVVDEKTAGKFSDSWMAQWDMDTQLSGYLKGVELYCAPGEMPHAIVRGVCPGTSKSPPGHMTVPVFRTLYQLDVWELQLWTDVDNMLRMFRQVLWDKRLGVGCVTYGRPCEYTQMCSSPNVQQLREANFEQSFWDPVTRMRSKT